MSQSIESLRYEGYEDSKLDEPLYQPPKQGSDPDPNGRIYYPYFPTEELQEAVNLAIALHRPLLIEGEPGCGKTRLAEAIAYEFTQKYLKDQKDEDGKQKWWFFREWNVKSVGRARDGLYTFDTVGRLRDAQLFGLGSAQIQELLEDDTEFTKLKARLKDKTRYLSFGALGEALKQTECERPIVLIDEIDKADSDFPNDLLRELDRLEFTIPELEDQKYPDPKASCRPKPIVIITSNRERPLPEPFLRRCLYFNLEFPDPTRLEKIIMGRFEAIDSKLLEKVLKHFEAVRDVFVDEVGSKPPGTSEILDFLMALSGKDVETAIANLAESSHAHLLGVVLKTERDQQIYRDNFGAS